jgi:hypothetical protein
LKQLQTNLQSFYSELIPGDYVHLKVVGVVKVVDTYHVFSENNKISYIKWEMPYGTLAGGISRLEEFEPIYLKPLYFRMLGFEKRGNPNFNEDGIRHVYYHTQQQKYFYTNINGCEFHFSKDRKYWWGKHNTVHLLQRFVKARWKYDLELKQEIKLSYNDIYFFPDDIF